MTTATIRLSLDGDDGVPLVARILGVGDEMTLSEAVVPPKGFIDVPVDPGSYAIQLLLPSGRILQKDRALVENGLAEVAFDARGRFSTELADGERFDLQSAVSDTGGEGLVSSAARLGAHAKLTAIAPPPTSVEYVRSRAIKRFGGSYQIAEPYTAARLSPRAREMLAAKRPKTALKKQPRSIIGKPRASASRSRLAPAATQYRAQLSLATISGLGNETAWKLAAVSPKRWPTGTVHTASWEPAVAPKDGVDLWTLDANAMTANGRLWATIDGPGGVELASIPLPWPVDSGEASVNVLVDTRIGGAAMTSVALTDAMYGGLLSYVAAGRISTVIPMIRHLEDTGGVEKALYGDDPNPLAVCIVAIARMATDPQDRSDKWDVWLRDLMERNPHIPDCAIVYARSVVIRPGELDESGNASRALRKAFDAGIPYYSTTLRLMRDMLFAGARRDEGLGAILEQVRPIVARCDPRGLTTVLRYPAGTE